MAHSMITTDAEFPDDNDLKADRFFSHAKNVAATAQFEYAIEMYIQGLTLALRNLTQHRALRRCALARKAAGGRPMGMFDTRKYPTNSKNSKQNTY